MTEDKIASVLKDVDGIVKDFETAEKNHSEYLHASKTMTNKETSSVKSLKHVKYVSSQVLKDMKRLMARKDLSADSREKLKDAQNKIMDIQDSVNDMQCDLPAEDNGFYLKIILGSNLNITLLDADSRYRYKQEYESFKVAVSYVVVVMLFLCYMFPYRALDALCNFLLVWYYCTLTIRESILRVNRSRIKGWWVIHHYISCVLAGIILTWGDTVCYRESRNLLIGLTAYVSLLQLLQNRYQTGCLRRLHSLGQRDDMDITVEGFSSWMFKGLTFLIPFLLVGYIVQGYCSYRLYTMYVTRDECKDEWQVLALAILFLTVASGNLITIFIVVIRKITQTSSVVNRLAAKYRRKIE
uniref:TMPIT-like protein n=2 Tax=Panagrolaimus sp. JU765 TaxID=591449 RepID=A0AC34Q6J8_9BILA